MNTNWKLTVTFLAALGCIITTLARLHAQTPEAGWYRIYSDDKKASVLFPNKAETIKTTTDKTPAGKVSTQVSEHQSEGLLFTISESRLPGLAVTFAGKDTIYKNAAGNVVNRAYGKQISTEKTKIDGHDALILRYECADFDEANHAGYRGLAVFVMVDKNLYLVNSMLSKETAGNVAMQDKLLKSLRIGG